MVRSFKRQHPIPKAKDPTTAPPLFSGPPIGAHMSIAGGPAKAWARIKAVGGECLQIFVKPHVQWKAGDLSLEAVEAFRRERERAGRLPAAAHASYLLNPASPDRELRRRTYLTLALEVVRTARLGIPYLVLHPGSHLGTGGKDGAKANR